MSDETIRERAVFPIGVPLGIFAAIGIVVFLFSRILLNVPKSVAIAVGLMSALNILIACAFVALRRVRGFTALLLVVVIAVPMVLGGAAAAKVIKLAKPAAAAKGPPAAQGGGGGAVSTGPITISAVNVAFTKTSLDIAANTATTVTLRNADTQPHNFDVFAGPPGYSPPSTPAIAQPGSSQTYNIPPLPAGSYQFRCDLHPSLMMGKLTVH